MATLQSYRDFVNVHAFLLASAGLPPHLYRVLYDKLNGALDAGAAFEVLPCENGRQRKLVLTRSELAKESDLFLVDHAWTFRLPDARKQLEEVPGLADRMSKLMCVADEPECLESPECETKNAQELIDQLKAEGSDLLELELDGLGIDDEQLQALDLASNFPNLITLSLWGNHLESLDTFLEAVSGLRSLRGLWVNDNPVASNHKLKNAVAEAFPSLEILNSKLLPDFGTWAVKFCASVETDLAEVEDLNLSDRDICNLPTKGFNTLQLPKLARLNLCGNTLAGTPRSDLVQLLKCFELLRSLEIDIPGPLGSTAVEVVEALPNLSKLNGVNVAELLEHENSFVEQSLKPRFCSYSPDESLVNRVMAAMWTYISTYRLADEEKLDETPIWYVMDEVGSAPRHSNIPNMIVVPFMHLPDGTMKSAMSFSLMWPRRDIVEGEECTRDYLTGAGEDKQRSARLTAWFYTPRQRFEQAYKMHRQVNLAATSKVPGDHAASTQSIFLQNARPLRVYSDIPQVCEFLNRPEFCLTDEPSKADILWPSWQIDEDSRQAAGLQPHQYMNQFPSEECLVMKHHLAETVRQAYGDPAWLPVTYNLGAQLAALIGDYNAREDRHEDNTWIIKPWNMARTIDVTITRSLPAIVRHIETGPKICQKYIEKPALFRGKKFDLRYVVLLRSLQPLELFLCDVFWVRLALNDYTTSESSFQEYETHFTVMNYRNKLNHMNTHEFVPAFEEEHKVKWMEIHERVRKMLRAVFEAASLVHPEMQSDRARAVYGVDVMLDCGLEPKLLEVTYCPDCTRACKYDVVKTGAARTEVMKGADFFNSVFGCLFLNEQRDMTAL